jgi:uncharacterized protein (TIGR03437 family)
VAGERFDAEGSRITLNDQDVPSLFTSPNQALLRLPKSLATGNYEVKVQSSETESLPVTLEVVAGEPVYDNLAFESGNSGGLAGDVAPKPGTGGRAVGDGLLTVADALRLLRRVLGLEPDPWP